MAVLDLQKIFTYPYDNEIILQKQKSIKRQLLATEEKRIKKRIAILSGATTSDIKNVMEIFLLEKGIQPEFYESEYNKWYEDGAYNNTALQRFSPEIILIITSSLNLLYSPNITDNAECVEKKFVEELSRWQKVWDNLSANYNAIIIQTNFDMPYCTDIGSLATVIPQGIISYICKLNEKFAEKARQSTNFYLFDLFSLAAKYGIERWHNRNQYYAYKLPFDYNAIPYVSSKLACMIAAILGKGKKCLALDLDNTLWGGVIGDDGLGGIELGHETPAGEAYVEFQKYVKRLKERGVILAVCSKNEDETAKSGFSHRDSILSVDDFISFKANWKPKNINLQEIAKEINIGTDSIVFIDDNPVERQLIRATMPEVACPEVDAQEVFSFIRAIEDAGYFETVSLSADDFKRNETYKENHKRQELEKSADTYEEFLKSLDMRAEIAPFKELYFDRITQLTNKTNQFNLTTKRCTLADIQQMATSDEYITLYGRLEDRFGDNGLISVIVGKKQGNQLNILLWLMSCRVLKRNMEQAMLDMLVEMSSKAGLKEIQGAYYPTAKNHMVENLYKELGFEKMSIDSKGTYWRLKTEEYRKQNAFIKILEGCRV